MYRMFTVRDGAHLYYVESSTCKITIGTDKWDLNCDQ